MAKKLPSEIKQAIALAQQEARRLNHAYVGTEHLLLAAIRDDAGLASNVLNTLSVETDRIRDEIAKLVTPCPTAPPAGQLPLTPRAKLAIEFACEEAGFVGCDDCGGGLMLVGLAREPDGVAAQVFRNLRLSLQQIAGEVFKIRVLQMKTVERIVRPVRCSAARKRKMREELLAHLSEIYDEELDRVGDPRVAIAEATGRFGDPKSLTAEFEKSLPRSEWHKYLFERWFGWRAPETATRWFTRLGFQLFLFLAALSGVAIIVDVLMAGPGFWQWRDARCLAAFLVLLPLAVCSQGILFYKMRDAMFGVFGSRKSTARVLLVQSQIVLLILGCSMALIAFAEWSPAAIPSSLLPIAVAAIGLSLTTRIVVRTTGPTEIRDTYWACLDIENVCES